MNRITKNRVFLACIGLFTCLLPLALRAAPPVIQPVDTNSVTAAEYRVVGVTKTLTDGQPVAIDQFGDTLSGFAAMDRLCQVEVDPNARVATAREWQTTRSFQLPAGVTVVWLDPGEVEVVFLPDAGNDQFDWEARAGKTGRSTKSVVLGSPGQARDFLDCSDYTSKSAAVLSVVGRRSGRLDFVGCSQPYPIACAALVAVPVRP